ncbi:hypothetical protein HCN44_009526 [Aphidius gifuensis]|uniref:Uncharacterized protein n=1 Tax=Aphidius gifuensis TaxID=684658 RepID=A0A834Y2J3_APHGI|nr:hypothetical protein HCN44_009526 [Aphidius gifuensis]
MAEENNENDDKSLENQDVKKETPSIIFTYSKSNFISGPERVENGTVPINIIQFNHSFGYECQRYFNMCVPDPDTIIFSSGSYINFFNTQTQEISFLRGSTGRGIGHITKNPVKPHIAVGENGTWPPIIIYEWPSMNIVTVLQQGTSKSYTHLAYNPDGSLLVSQGGEPDYSITIWDWKQSKIMLRCKSHSQDVFNAIFSPTVPDHLTTSGSGHVKFWKISKTFTGLKLKGEIGRFGGTEISDVIGVYSMNDEKVITGCEWGNILIWEEGLIKIEVRRKNKISCHNNMITQFEFINGELMSIGMDGWIRVWYYETIDQADPPEDERFIEIEPIYEFQICKNRGQINEEKSMLMGITRVNPDNLKDTFWYAQDSNGGLWLIDLNTLGSPRLPKKLFTCHSGAIVDMSVCTWNYYVATCGKDGRLHVYNYLTNKLIIVYTFCDSGSQVVWLPCSIESSGRTIICAFESGIIRVVTVDVDGADVARANDPEENNFVKLVQVVKPHTAGITVMSLNKLENILVTGSQDSTIFIFQIKISDEFPELIPIGFIKLPSGISCITWHPKKTLVVFVGCLKGECSEIELPNKPQNYTTISYELKIPQKLFKFISVKSEIRCEIIRLEIEKRKNEKKDQMRLKMEQYKAANPGVQIDEDTFLMDNEEYPPLPEIYIPEIPNPVLMINYIDENKIWLWMGGFDAGYIYEYNTPESEILIEEKPLKSVVIFDADDTEIYSQLIQNEEYLYLGMQNGEIRICRINKNEPTDLSDYLVLPMHDNSNGKISKILLSHDETMLLTCGWDGNLFSYKINENSYIKKNGEEPKASKKIIKKSISDINDKNYPSVEEVLNKAEHDRLLDLANKKKNITLEILKTLSEEFHDFNLDPRITEDLDKQLKAEIDLVHEKMSFTVEKSRLGLKKLMDHFINPITCFPFAVCRISKPDTKVYSLKERILGDDFTKKYNEVVKKIEENKKTIRSLEVTSQVKLDDEEEISEVSEIESFLKDLSPDTIEHKLGVRINQMLRKYRERKLRIEKRAKEWKILEASKPDPNEDHPEDISVIEEAKKTIGDYKLKISTDVNLNQDNCETSWTKYKQLLDCRKRTHYKRENFNDRLKSIRSKKLTTQAEVKNLIEKLKLIHLEIPDKYIKPLPEIPQIDIELEFPEHNLELRDYDEELETSDTKTTKDLIIEEIIDPIDEEYEVLLLDETRLRLIENEINLSPSNSDENVKKRLIIPDNLIKCLNDNDQVETSWEREMKLSRISKKVYEQDCILSHIKKCFDEIDEELDDLEKERLIINADSIYSELFQLTLNQELIVLRDFEEKENYLRCQLEDQVKERISIQNKVKYLSSMIDQKNREISKLHVNIRELNHKFSLMINENEFNEFFKKIYKKNKNNQDDDDDDGDDDKDNEDMNYLSKKYFPAGCDQELYDAALTMRAERHKLEDITQDEEKNIEIFKKELDEELKNLNSIDNFHKQTEQELKEYLIEKRKKLNDIDMTVILKFHQLQHMNGDDFEKISDCVVFDKTKLSKLYTRVGELQQETEEQKIKHKKNKTHLHRMEIDCRYMDDEIKNLKSEIKNEMIKKFGREISLSSLYEAVLRKMVNDIKADIKEMSKHYDQEIKCVKKNYQEQVKVLESLIQDNTEKLSFLRD